MRARLSVILLLTIQIAFLSVQVYADTGRLAIGVKNSTLGLGGEVTARITSNVNARFGINAFSLGLDGKVSDIEYDFDVDLLSYSALLDWYPFKGSFRVSGGVLVNESEVGLSTTPVVPLMIGGTTYTPAEIGVLSGILSFDNVAPYVGIGWGNAFGKDKRWGFISDIGVAYIGSPNVNLSANGLMAADPTFRTNLATERADIEKDLEDFKFYPVFSLSFFFRF